MEQLGTKIERLRKSKGLSQKDLSKKAGVSQQIIARWENNKTVPKYDKLIPLSTALGIPVQQLLLDEAADSVVQTTTETSAILIRDELIAVMKENAALRKQLADCEAGKA